MVALDADASLLEALERRAAGLPVETVVADARSFSLARRFPLVLVPMQTLQLLGGPAGRTAFLRRALDHLAPGGLLAAALADALDCFDEEHDLPPPPDACEVDGVRYASRLLAVDDEDGRAALRRRREIIGPRGRYESRELNPARAPPRRHAPGPSPARSRVLRPDRPSSFAVADRCFVALRVGTRPTSCRAGTGRSPDRVYFSFTVMTHHGKFGGFHGLHSRFGAAGSRSLEDAVGQIYLVTVIGVLVGGLVGRRQR